MSTNEANTRNVPKQGGAPKTAKDYKDRGLDPKPYGKAVKK